MSRVRPLLRRVPLPLALLLAVAATLSLSWTLATATLQGPDEYDHAAFVEHLAEAGDIPSATGGTGSYAADQGAAMTTLGYYWIFQNRLARPAWGSQAERQWAETEAALPAGASESGSGPNPVGKSPPLYYAWEALGWKLTPGGVLDKLFVARLFSGLLLLAMVTFAWLLAGEVFARQRLPQTVAAGVVALLPMNGYMSGIINTDIMLATVWTAFLYVSIRAVRLGLTPKRAGLMALMTVLSVLTHGRGLALIPILAIALLVAWLHHQRTLRATLVNAASAAGVMILGFLVYRVVASASGAGSLYGGEVNLGDRSIFNLRQLASSIWQFYLPKLDAMESRLGPGIGYRQIMVQQYFAGIFSSFEVYFPYWVYDLVQIAAAVLFVALYTLAIVRRRTLLRHWAPAFVLTSTALVLLLFLHVASYRALVNGSANPLIVGRYLLPLGAVLGVAIAALVAGLPRRVGAALGSVVLIGLLALSVGGLALSVERFYV